MAYSKYVYNRVNWMNKSEGLTTPLGKTNLNRMDSAIYNIAENLDIAYNEFSVKKFDKADASKVISEMPVYDENTGILKFKFYDGTEFLVDFNIEKIPVSFSMNSAGVITMVTADGTEWTADIGDVIPTYDYVDSDTIAFSDTKDGDYGHLVSAQIKKNSITGKYLQPNYLADVTTQASNAVASAQSASEYADNAAYDAKLAQSYAVGNSGIREGENDDCAKKYKEEAEQSASEAAGYLADMQSSQVTGVKGDAEENYRKGNVNITKENIGLGNVDNTSDSDKPISTAQQTALDQKVNKSGDAMTGGLEVTYLQSKGTKMTLTNGRDYSMSAPNTSKLYGDSLAITSPGTVGDMGWIRMLGTDENDTVFEIATGDDANAPTASTIEEIAVRQYGTDNAIHREIKLFDKNGNSSFSGTVTAPEFIGNATSATNADTVDNKHASNFLGNGTGYVCPFYVGDLNTLVTDWHGFIFNCSNTPSGQNWGFLDVVYFDGSGFSPSPPGHGVIRQIFTGYTPSGMWLRNRILFNGVDTWTVWLKVSDEGNAVSLNTGIGGRVEGANITNTIALVAGSYYLKLSQYTDHASFEPFDTNLIDLGGGGLRRFRQVYAVNSSISTSDRREKKNISYIGKESNYDTSMSDEQLEKLIMGIKPVVFKRKNGESGRPHHGLISQDFEELLQEIGLSDHAGFIKSPKTIDVEEEIEVEKEITNDDGEKETVIEKQKVLKPKEIEGEYTYGFRYEELITDIIRFCQLQKEYINNQQNEINVLKQEIDEIKLVNHKCH